MSSQPLVGEFNTVPSTVGSGQKPLIQTDAQGRLLVGGAGAAGTPAGGVQSIQGFGYSSVVSFARTADTNVYAALDVIGINNAGSPGAAALTFAGIGPAGGGEVIITTAQFEIDIAAIVSGMTSFVLYLYNVTPPSALVDNNAWDLPAGDRASFVGYVPLGAPVDLGSTLYVLTTQINTQFTVPSGGSLFGYLVTVGTWTPASGSVFKTTLKAVGI